MKPVIPLFFVLPLRVVVALSEQASSIDGSCGGSKGHSCMGTPRGSCCSQWGWCGSTKEYCGTGCQRAFGDCSSSSALRLSPDGSCGESSRYTCSKSESGGMCCSQWGWCGWTDKYCGAGCQSGFGFCFSSTTGKTSSKRSATASSKSTTSSERQSSSRLTSARSSSNPDSSTPRSSVPLSPSMQSAPLSSPYSSSSSLLSTSSSKSFSSVNTMASSSSISLPSSAAASSPATGTRDSLENPAYFTVKTSSNLVTAKFVNASDAHYGNSYISVRSSDLFSAVVDVSTTMTLHTGVQYRISLWARSVGSAGCFAQILMDGSLIAQSTNSLPQDWSQTYGYYTVSSDSSSLLNIKIICPPANNGDNKRKKRQSSAPGLDVDDLVFTEATLNDPCAPVLQDSSFEECGATGTSSDWEIGDSGSSANFFYAHPENNQGQGDGSYAFVLWSNASTTGTYTWNYLHPINICANVAYQVGLVGRTYTEVVVGLGLQNTEGCRIAGYLDGLQAFTDRIGGPDARLRYIGGPVTPTTDNAAASLSYQITCPTNHFSLKTRGIFVDKVHVIPLDSFVAPAPTAMYSTSVATAATSTFPYTTSCTPTATARPNGYTTCIQAGELIPNPSFEDCAAPSTYAFISAGGYVAASSGISADAAHTGSRSFKANFTTGGGLLGISFNGFVPCPERNYRYSFWILTALATCSVAQYWGTQLMQNSANVASAGQWVQVSKALADPFGAAGTGFSALNANSFQLRITCNGAGVIYLDDVSFTQTSGLDYWD